jgi:glucokinase
MKTLAMDIGGTMAKLGLVVDGRLVGEGAIESHSSRGLAALLPVLQSTARALAERNGLELSDFDGVGICFPGTIDSASRRITSVPAGKFDDAIGIDLVDWCRRAFSLPLAIENDARAAVLGEWKSGAGQGCAHFVLVTLGTGIGVGVVVDGRPLRGAHGTAGILAGHWTVRLDGELCACGNIGCVELEASQGVLPRLNERFGITGETELKDYRQVFAAAAEGDSIAQIIRDHSLRAWAVHAVNLIHAYDPQVMAYGGGIARASDVILPALRQYVARHAWAPVRDVQLVASRLGDRAALLGCEQLVRELLSGR